MKKKQVTSGLMVFILALISIVSILPFYMMIMMGTYYANDLYKGIKIIPGDFLFENLKTITAINFPTYYFNSLLAAFTSAVLCALVCSLCGFGLAKYKFKLKKVLHSIIMATMMIPGVLSLVGYMLEMRAMGLLGTLLPIILPLIASPFGAFWMTQFTKSAIPDSVLESARIDGCNDFAAFWKIAFPFLRPAFMTLIMLTFLWSWNAFLLPMIVISNEPLYTIPLGIRQLSTQFRFDAGAQILGLTFSTIPMLLIFAVFSKNLISGLSAAAIKE